ncbi:hypothetical protein GCM10009741_47300 [Kribbella lupini]|uniref:PH (Pleckstrin Homology) domain-containing protein n=1 Tax=Kribbella lupini TaxID=291602 RepID=A0ABN2BDX8_9ACTN
MCLGFPVSGELARRHRKVQLVVGLIYLGLPVLTLGVSLATAGLTGAVLPAVLLVLGVLLFPRQRFRPQRWRMTGAIFGAVSAVYLTLVPDNFALVFILLAVLVIWWLGAGVGVALAAYAERTLLVPVDPELAGTPYELAFRLRGLWGTSIVLGTETVSIHTIPRKLRGANPEDLRRTYPFTKVTGVHEVDLTGSERLRFPIPVAAVRTPGPAVILQAAGDDWVLPTNLAPTLTQLLQHRVDGAKSA